MANLAAQALELLEQENQTLREQLKKIEQERNEYRDIVNRRIALPMLKQATPLPIRRSRTSNMPYPPFVKPDRD